ncbi:MAG TPA: T9SS type A sorting domain-containing protein [Candidatus Cloacimonadota bacterium]|nr:T9SS type A sorting domain-containing protein [Candidatus Cloacimonadota bacterium]
MKTVKLPLLVIVFFASISILFSQTWIRSYSWEDLCPGYTSADAKAWNVIPAIGGGYLLQGYVCFLCSIDVPAFEDNVFWKIDENGDVVWRRTGVSFLADNALVSDGSNRYYCLNSHQGSSDLYVYDSELNFINYYGFQNVNGYDCQLNDMLYDNDGLVFAGKSRTGQSIILKTDFQLNLNWQSNPINNFYNNGFYKIVKNTNQTLTAVNYNIIAEYSALGDTLWSVRTDLWDNAYYCIANHSNGMIYVLNRSYSNDCWMLDEYNSLGECTQSNNTNLMNITAEGKRNMMETSDHNLLLLMASSNVLSKISPSGNIIWSRSYPIADMGLNSNTGYGPKNMLIDSLGYIVFCGGGTLGVMTLVRADSSGIVTSNEDEYTPLFTIKISHYPNPVTSSFTVKINSEEHITNPRIEIYNIKGQRVLTKPFPKNSIECIINFSEFGHDKISSGLYFYRVMSNTISSKLNKLIVIK